jgi:hypothetical protein
VETDRYILANLATAPLLVNSETLINGMVYSDSITLSLINLASYVNIPSTLSDHLYIAGLTVKRNGINVPVVTEKTTSSYSFYETGMYEFTVRYRVGATDAGLRTSVHTVYLINGVQQSFSYNSGNSEITSIKFNGVEVRNNWKEERLTQVNLNARLGNGYYDVTVAFADSVLETVKPRTFRINVVAMPSASGYIDCGAFGESTTGRVDITANFYMMYTAYGESTITVTRNGEVLSSFTITAVSASGRTPVTIASVASDGKYLVQLDTSDGKYLWSDGFEIYTKETSMAFLFVIVAGIGVVIAVVIFIRLRHNMRVK